MSPGALANREHSYDLELTHTSNAIEGNTLTQIESSLMIEREPTVQVGYAGMEIDARGGDSDRMNALKGITVGGEPLKDHLEAVDHHDAILSVLDLAQ